MNAHDLIDESLGLLEDDAHQRFERAIASDPALAEKAQRLRAAVQRLLDDGDAIEPPPDLAARTIAQVDRFRQRPRLLEFVPVPASLRWSDVAVAAAILVAGLLTLIPAMHRSQLKMAQMTCVSNLRQIGQALNQYATTHETYPYVAPDCPASYVGSFAVLLNEGGFLYDPTAIRCPLGTQKKSQPVALPAFADLCCQETEQPGSLQHTMCADYAYSQGYRTSNGQPAPLPVRLGAAVPILADQPPHDPKTYRILDGNSPNHGGGGQNVLFTGGHVQWHRNRWISPRDTDVYLNEHDRPAPGVHAHDAVLSPAVFRFTR